jgi:GMP synthase-like glutamine amidotransferase
MKLLVLQHEKCEPLGIFEELLKKKGVEYKYCRLYEERAPADLSKYNALILMGGMMTG